MKIQTLVLISAAVILCACATPQTNQNQPQNAAVQPVQENKKPSLSPTETLRALSTASQSKNPEEIKKYLSKGTLEAFQKVAEENKKPLDELLKEEGGPPFPIMPETRNEKIDGDTATVEVKDAETGEFDVIPFVKENGEWKVALDLYLQELEKKFAEDMKKPPPGKPKK